MEKALSNIGEASEYVLERGEVSAGFVYRSDTYASKNIQIDQTIEQTMYSEIVYPIAIIDRAHNSPQTESAYNFLTSPRAIQVFEKHGFRPLTKKMLTEPLQLYATQAS